MSAEIHLFVPRANRNADRAFWKGNALAEDVKKSLERPEDTAPAEYCYVAPDTDSA